MLDEAINGHLVAVDHVQYARGEASLLEEFSDEHRCGWIPLGWLEDEGVPAGNGVGEHPHGDHGREVERRDAGHHAKGPAHGVDVHTGTSTLAVEALERIGDAAGELHILDAPGHLTTGVVQHLAVLGR